MVVFDANVFAALVLDLPWSRQARRLIAEADRRIAPSIVVAEIGNSLWLNVRKENLSPPLALRALDHLLSLVEVVPNRTLVAPALQIAVEHDHPVYDCFYLALAEQEKAHLVTADKKLAALAKMSGVEVTGLA